MQVTPQINSFAVTALIWTWTAVIPLLAGLVIWFVRKDRNAAFDKLRVHAGRLDKVEKSVAELDGAVFGINGEGGTMKWETKMRSVMQPFTSELETVSSRLDKFALALARAVPGIELKDLH